MKIAYSEDREWYNMMQHDVTFGTYMRALVRDFAKINLLLLYRTFCYNEKKFGVFIAILFYIIQ